VALSRYVPIRPSKPILGRRAFRRASAAGTLHAHISRKLDRGLASGQPADRIDQRRRKSIRQHKHARKLARIEIELVAPRGPVLSASMRPTASTARPPKIFSNREPFEIKLIAVIFSGSRPLRALKSIIRALFDIERQPSRRAPLQIEPGKNVRPPASRCRYRFSLAPAPIKVRRPVGDPAKRSRNGLRAWPDRTCS